MKQLENMTEVELRDLCNNMGSGLLEIAHDHGLDKLHFALLIFNDPKIAQYVCNCRRRDVILAMRECADRLEAREDVER